MNILYFSVFFLLSFTLTYVVIIFARKKLILDIPNERSSHTIPTPRTGGIAIAIVWYLYILVDIFIIKQLNQLSYTFLFCLPLSFISLIDDFITVKPLYRFMVQMVCVVLLWLSIFVNNNIFERSLLLVIIVSAITIFSGIWFVNLYNFMDGIDGYAAAQAIVFFLISYYITKEIFLLALTAIVLGFLVWNWHPAKIFMGDTGSTLIGFIILTCALYFHFSNRQNIFISFAFTSVFWFDATITLFRRIINKEIVSIAHRKHAYQRLVQSGLKHHQVTLILTSIYIIIFVIMLFSINKYSNILILLSSLALNIIFYGVAEKRMAFKS